MLGRSGESRIRVFHFRTGRLVSRGIYATNVEPPAPSLWEDNCRSLLFWELKYGRAVQYVPLKEDMCMCVCVRDCVIFCLKCRHLTNECRTECATLRMQDRVCHLVVSRQLIMTEIKGCSGCAFACSNTS